jgi:predicted metal-dependent peptidase
VAAALVLTDGYIDVPAEEPEFRVLWVLLGNVNQQFAPSYGATVVMDVSLHS